jgi:hypothetical protein
MASSVAIKSLKDNEGSTIYAFLTYRDEKHNNPLKVFQSLIFQLLVENKSLRAVVHDAYLSNYRQLTGARDFVRALLYNLLQDCGLTYIIIDGLDEVDGRDRGYLLKSLLDMLKQCKDVKLLLSSRPERSIARELVRVATSIRVDQVNRLDIATYVREEGNDLVSRFRDWGAEEDVLVEVRKSLDSITDKANGGNLSADEAL